MLIVFTALGMILLTVEQDVRHIMAMTEIKIDFFIETCLFNW